MSRAIPVFVSFATPDRETALEVCEALERRGCDGWISIRDLGAGSRFGDEIIRRIKSSDALVVMLSTAANESEFVPREVERAVHYRIPVFPLRIEDVLPGPALELFISSHQWVDLWADDFERRMDRLARDIRQQSGRPAAEDTPAPSGDRHAAQKSGATAPPRGGWLSKYGGLLIAAAAVAIFAIFNLPRVGRSSDPSLEARDGDSLSAQSPGADTASMVVDATSDTPDPGQPGSEALRAATPPQETRPADPGVIDGRATSASADGPEPSPAEGILIVVYDQGDGEGRTVESILMDELASLRRPLLDRTSVGDGPLPTGPAGLSELRSAGGVDLLIVADLVTEATQFRQNMYTGRATLAVRTYDTATGGLVDSRSIQVGTGGEPGLIGASPMVARNNAATMIAHRASTALAREVRQAIAR